MESAISSAERHSQKPISDDDHHQHDGFVEAAHEQIDVLVAPAAADREVRAMIRSSGKPRLHVRRASRRPACAKSADLLRPSPSAPPAVMARVRCQLPVASAPGVEVQVAGGLFVAAHDVDQVAQVDRRAVRVRRRWSRRRSRSRS